MLSFSSLLALVSIVHAAPPADCGDPVFTFVGQPDCVSLAFDGARTQLQNHCGVPLLVDLSVLVAGDGPSIPAGGAAELRDLSAFTIGMAGEIHPAVAVVEVPECPAPSAPDPVVAPEGAGSWLRSVLAFVRVDGAGG